MIPLVTKDTTRTVVCSLDPAVTLKHQLGKEPRVREARRPVRWLDADPSQGEVEAVGPDALRVTYRPLDGDEQFEVTGGLAVLTNDRLGACYQQATRLAVVAASGPGLDARTPDEVRAFLKRMKLVQREPLGERIADESMGFADPLPSSE